MSDETNKLADEVAAEGASPAEVTAGPDDETVDAATLSATESVGEETAAEQSESTASEEISAEDESFEQSGDEQADDADEDATAESVEPDLETGEVEAEVAEDETAEDETIADETADEAEEAADPGDAEVAEESTATTVADGEGAESDEIKMDWYILKVQSNREKSITAALKRKIAVEGLEDYFGEVVVPVEKVTEFKGGKKKVVNRKLYPGYIVVNMHINDDTWFAVRETSGIGDFTGSGGKPTPMLPSEVARIIQTEEEETEDAPKLNISFKIGDRVKVNDGNFESFEGEVNAIDEHSGRITVMINIFGRSTPVELEYWQVEQA